MADLYLEGWQGGGGEALGRGKKHMAKQLTEQELRQQARPGVDDSLGPVDALRFLGLVSRPSPSTTSSGGRSIFHTTAWMNYSRKFGVTTAGSIPKRRSDHYFPLSSA